MNEEIIKKLKDFVKKYNERKYVIETSPFGLDLAKAVHDFEIANESFSDYHSRVSDLNREIDNVIASEYLKDNFTIQKLDELENRCKQLDNQLKDANSKIETLIEERGALKGKLEVYERDVPKSDTFTGDVDD